MKTNLNIQIKHVTCIVGHDTSTPTNENDNGYKHVNATCTWNMQMKSETSKLIVPQCDL